MKPSTAIIFLILFTCSSCVTIKTREICSYGRFKFTQKPDEINISPNLTNFLISNPACKFVLRVPVKPNNVVEEDKFFNKLWYFSIEKVLIDNYFRVIDRSLFEKKISDDNALEKTADLILELVDFRTVNYYTNKVVTEENNKSEKEFTLPKYYFFTGAQATFKIVDIRTCEIVATFVLHYTPCTKGCRMLYCSSGRVEEIKGDMVTRKKIGYKSVDIDIENEMFLDLTKRLVGELRKRVIDE